MRYSPGVLLLLCAGLANFHAPSVRAEEASSPASTVSTIPVLPVVESIAAEEKPQLSEQIRAGWASYYAKYFQGRKTATGERFDHAGFTAASNQFPLGTKVAVRRAGTNNCVLVRVNDRMAKRYGWLRLLDLTESAAAQLQMLKMGVAPIQVQIVSGKDITANSACKLAFGLPSSVPALQDLPDILDAHLRPPTGEPRVPQLEPLLEAPPPATLPTTLPTTTLPNLSAMPNAATTAITSANSDMPAAN